MIVFLILMMLPFASLYAEEIIRIRSSIADRVHKPTQQLRVTSLNNGLLTAASVKELLAAAIDNSFSSRFTAPERLSVYEMAEEKKHALRTTQLFAIDYNGAESKHESFVLKGMGRPGKETRGLGKAHSYETLRPYIYPNSVVDAPQLIFPIACLSYEYNDKTWNFSLMPRARGRSLLSFLTEFVDSPDKEHLRELIGAAYYKTGRMMANFYKALWVPNNGLGSLPKGITHGDLHVGNVMYDHENGTIALIDNDKIVHSIEKPKDCTGDIKFLLTNYVFLIPDQLQPYWYELTISNFTEGFLSSFEESERPYWYNAIKRALLSTDHKAVIEFIFA